MEIQIKVVLFGRTFMIFYITEDHIIVPEENHDLTLFKSCDNIKIEKSSNTEDRKLHCKRVKFNVSALFLQPFLEICTNSKNFRGNVTSKMLELSSIKCEIFIKLKLEPPDKEIVDYVWNEKILYLLWSRMEIEHAFAWLSTLGGAYSALGDYFDHCAEEAGRISVRQYKLSKILGDDSLAARSKLYSALAFSQKGYLKLSRKIVREVAEFSRITNDKRLNKMCQGVWVKLKYLRLLKEMKDNCKIASVNK